MMYGCCQEPKKHHNAVYQKYESIKYKRASIFVADRIENGFTLPFLSGLVPSQYPSVAAPAPTMDEESHLMMEYRRASVVVSS